MVACSQNLTNGLGTASNMHWVKLFLAGYFGGQAFFGRRGFKFRVPSLIIHGLSMAHLNFY